MKLAMWVLMLAFNLIVPVVMILLGRLFETNPPHEINATFGYRTSRSMKSQDAWDFAQRYTGALWRKAGWVMLPLAALAQALTLLCPAMDAMCLWSLIPTALEVAALVATIFPVERALKKRFDENGVRRQY